MQSLQYYYTLLTILLFTRSLKTSAITYNVAEMGANSEAQTDSSESLLNAWASVCASAEPATIYVPPGTYMVGKAYFYGTHCKSKEITIRIDGSLVRSMEYDVKGRKDNWIIFEEANGVSIVGGTFDGNGAGLWACKASGKTCPIGATTLAFYNSKNIMMTRLTSRDSQMFHIVIDRCENVEIQEMSILAPGDSPNTDGIHVELSSRVTILNSRISTGDDCISLGPGSSNLWIENIICGPGHGISIGSLGWKLEEPGVQNVTVKKVNFMGTKNGVRIKTWGRPSHGFVNKVSFQHLIMFNVHNPIIIDQNYCPHNNNCPRQSSGVKISDVAYEDIHGSSATPVGVKFDCSKKYGCTGLKMEDVNLTFNDQPAAASCINTSGSSSGLQEDTKCF